VVADIVLLSMLAAFALACLVHASIWIHNGGEREHFWFALASLAAAGAAAAQWFASRSPAHPGATTSPFLLSFLLFWLVATSWFVAEGGGGDRWHRRGAGLATGLLLLVATAGVVSGPEALFESGSPWRGPAGALIVLAIAIVLALCVDSVIRLYRSSRRQRALAIAVIAVALVLAALHRSWQPAAQPDYGWLAAFALVVLLALHELTRLVAESKLAAQRQGHELAHASRLSVVGELSAAIAHEINQPLGAILNNADAGEILLEDPEPPLEEIRKILADIRRDGLRASEVIRHLRRLVKKREMELGKLDASLVVTDVIALLAAETRRRRQVIVSLLPPEPRYVSGDRALLEQVLINLVLNAMDAMESLPPAAAARRPRAPIELGVATTSHGEVEIWIRDAGPGIPAARLRHLFDSFYTSKPHGMGLGLSIARSIVEAHGGRIQVENSVGAGACFRITLPPFYEARE
jgi:signal transduction histidine kinase